MKAALENLRNQVLSIAGKYSASKKRAELEQAFELLAAELYRPHVQSQRVMQLLRGILKAQPGSAKGINKFLTNSKVARAMSAGSNFHLNE